MKKAIVLLILLVLLVTAFTSVAYAAPGGMPAAHGVDGRTFGGVVAGLATTNPLALADHVAGCFGP